MKDAHVLLHYLFLACAQFPDISFRWLDVMNKFTTFMFWVKIDQYISIFPKSSRKLGTFGRISVFFKLWWTWTILSICTATCHILLFVIEEHYFIDGWMNGPIGLRKWSINMAHEACESLCLTFQCACFCTGSQQRQLAFPCCGLRVVINLIILCTKMVC